MHILIDGRMILPEMTGVGRYLLGLVAALGRIAPDEKFELLIQAGLPASHPAWQLQGSSVHLVPVPLPHMTLRQHWEIPAIVRQRQPDLVHYPHFDLPLGTPGPLVVTIHDLKYLMRPEFFPHAGYTKRAIMKLMMAHALRRADRVIADSKHTRQDLGQIFELDQRKVLVSYLGVDSHFFHPPSSETLQEAADRYGLSYPYFLFVGERRPHKNLSNLIRAFNIHREQFRRQNIHLVVAGKPYSSYQDPEHLVKSLNLEDQIHFIDYVSEPSLPGLYRQARAFILPSYYEGFGLPVLEAMACGTPVIAAKRTSLPEIVGPAGILIDPDDPEDIGAGLRKANQDMAWRKQVIEEGSQRAREFSWDRCASQTLAVYQEVVAHDGP